MMTDSDAPLPSGRSCGTVHSVSEGRAFRPTDLNDVFCYLKMSLEPRYRVVAEPDAGYFAHQQYCYRVFDQQHSIAELAGRAGSISDTEVVRDAVALVQRLQPHLQAGPATSPQQSQPRGDLPAVSSTAGRALPYASRLPPSASPWTFFSSGRAAFAFLLRDVVAARRIFLPTFICWSLVDVVQKSFADREVIFYSVDSQLGCQLPPDLTADDAIVWIHYFGQHRSLPSGLPSTLLNDCSHLLLAEDDPTDPRTTYSFGSLRKMYRVPDGGFITGDFHPLYESDRHLEGWLRQQAADWTDLREAENMVDRRWRMSDISGRSLAIILRADRQAIRQKRRSNHQFLLDHFCGGRSHLSFDEHDVPLLHNRAFESRQQRDDLKAFLAKHGFFASIHWPVHEVVLAQREVCDVSGALWLQDHTFALPVAEDFDEQMLSSVCEASRQFERAGASRYVQLDAG